MGPGWEVSKWNEDDGTETGAGVFQRVSGGVAHEKKGWVNISS